MDGILSDRIKRPCICLPMLGKAGDNTIKTYTNPSHRGKTVKKNSIIYFLYTVFSIYGCWKYVFSMTKLNNCVWALYKIYKYKFTRVSKFHGNRDALPCKIFYNLRKILTVKRKTEEKTALVMLLVQFQTLVLGHICFYSKFILLL